MRSQSRPLTLRHDYATAPSHSPKTCLEATSSAPDELESGVCQPTDEGEGQAFLGQTVPRRCRSYPEACPRIRWHRPYSHWSILLFKTESSGRDSREHENSPYAMRLPAPFRSLRPNLSISIFYRGPGNQSRIPNYIATRWRTSSQPSRLWGADRHLPGHLCLLSWILRGPAKRFRKFSLSIPQTAFVWNGRTDRHPAPGKEYDVF